MKTTTLHVIAGNNKLGHIPNVSLLPIVTCDRSAPCAKGRQCYACKFLHRQSVRAAWGENTELAKRPAQFFAQLSEYFSGINSPRFFRFFVGGDAPTLAFARRLVAFCESHPTTRFLWFTKRYKWVAAILADTTCPANLSIVLSAWPGFPLDNPHLLPVAWMRDEKQPDDRIPSDALECPGGCDSCGMCWELGSIDRDVVFDKH